MNHPTSSDLSCRKEEITSLPQLSNAGLAATCEVVVQDEYQNERKLDISDERPLTIYIDGNEIVTLMTIGTHPELLTLGYIKNQALVTDLADIQSVQVDWEVAAAAVTTNLQRNDWQERLGPRIVTTGCGQGTVFGNVIEQLENSNITPRKLLQSTLYTLLGNINHCNTVYRKAGAVHGCALCMGTEIIHFVEDVGRHNAVDAITGEMWLQGMDGADKLFYTTGRLTSEMVIKVAQMGIPTLISRSGITQMGLRIAQDMGITLIARAQRQHFLLCNGNENIVFDVRLPAKKEVGNLLQRRK